MYIANLVVRHMLYFAQFSSFGKITLPGYPMLSSANSQPSSNSLFNVSRKIGSGFSAGFQNLKLLR